MSGEPEAREKSAAEPLPRSRKQYAPVLARVGYCVLGLLLALSLFTLGNVVSYVGAFDVAPLFGLSDPRAAGAADAEALVSPLQLVARVREAAEVIDELGLHRFSQAEMDEATAAAIKGLLEASGDPYAVYYSPSEYNAYTQVSSGVYGGIGVVLVELDGAVTVLEVYPSSPAAEAGVLPGDTILAIDGQRQQWTSADATQAVQRPEGEQVEIIWGRGDSERSTTMTLRMVNVPTVVGQLIQTSGHTIGYIYLRRFTDTSGQELREVISELEGLGATSLILDLRGNPGGYLSQAVDVTSVFVPSGIVVQIESRSGIVSESVSGDALTSIPVAVLVNGESASASELVSAALQDHGRAIIVGEQTYGKGTVQNINVLSFGGAIKYTSAHYMSPNGRTLDGVGVTPDIVVAPGEVPELTADNLPDYITHNPGSADFSYVAGWDAQLDAAIGALS
ncbi:MAG: S41 family peptidase [Coriobacteriales bacterium]|nr:S41 family peptidase [Coriobacteriales bacterium]